MARGRIYEVRGSHIVSPEGDEYRRNARARRNDYGSFEEALVPVVDTFEQAQRIREKFYGKAIRSETPLQIRWPRFVSYVGITNGEQYLSDKKLANWKKTLFKHLAEYRQFLFINPQLTQLLNDRGERVELREASRRLRAPVGGDDPVAFSASTKELRGPMPQHIADLAEDKGVQWLASDGSVWEMRMKAKCTLAAAPVVQRVPGGAKVFLFSYSDEGVHYIITGHKLDVTEDGIVNN